jgi:predicted RNA binding protein YcfA (HicA-like mRNA interferase family)
MKAREVIRALAEAGWIEARSKGSHCHFKHPDRAGLVTVPLHGSADLKIGVIASIERQSGVMLRKTK